MGYVPPQGMGGGGAEIPKPLLKGYGFHFGYVIDKLVPEYDNFTPITFLGGSIHDHPNGSFVGSRSTYGGDSGYSVYSDEDTYGYITLIQTAATANYDVHLRVFTGIYDNNPHQTPFCCFNLQGMQASFSVYKALVRMASTTNLRVVITGNYYVTDLGSLPNFEMPYFRVFTDLGETNWMACQRDSAGGETVVDTGVALDDEWHIFKMECYKDKTKYYIDDVLVAEISENLDRVKHYYYFFSFTLRTLENVRKEMRVAYALSGLVF